jgi:metallo-beta-lactamase family protein
MRLTFWGAARTVTGSMHLLELESGHTLLMDCGLYQGRRAQARQINSELPFDASKIDVVLLSHAHIDHSGLLPLLWKDGFRGRIYATFATYDLCAVMLMDSAYIQEKDTKYVNKRHRKRGEPEVEPLYMEEDAEEVLDHFAGVGYRQLFTPVPGVKVEYRDAGHILGSASMVLEITENGKTTKLGFTGDVGRPDRPILRDPQGMSDCDFLISESTYGGKTHDPPDTSKGKLLEVVTRTSERGGRVIIPAFSVGRTQEIVYILDQLAHDKQLPPIPVYVDSPMAVNATGVFQLHPECYDRQLREYIIKDGDAFGFDRLHYVRGVEQSKAINTMDGPMVIISASGMCEAGRILHHLKNNVENPKNTIMMVGYCAQHTLGKRLVDRNDKVKIFGDEYSLRAEVAVMNSYSAHADEPELIDFIGKMDRDRLKNIFLVHGDIQRQELLRTALNKEGYSDVLIPDKGDSYDRVRTLPSLRSPDAENRRDVVRPNRDRRRRTCLVTSIFVLPKHV